MTTRHARSVDVRDLPVISLGSRPLAEVARDLGRAAEEIGFFYVADHGVPESLVARVSEASACFHALPLEDKRKLAINRFHRGYIGLESYRLNEELAPNLSESLVMMHELPPDDPGLLAEMPLQGPNQWPELSGFREAMLDYVAAMERLGRRLLSGFAVSLSLPEGYFEEMFRKPTTFLRLLHYPPQSEDDPENRYGSAPHTDYGAITMLAQDASGGLHVQHRSGEWIAATPVPSTFVVNIGDVMARWTNDRFVSTRHRVINATGHDRYSVPFFFDPGMEATIECLPTCRGKGAENPPKYPPISYGDYLLSRLDAHYAYRSSSAC